MKSKVSELSQIYYRAHPVRYTALLAAALTGINSVMIEVLLWAGAKFGFGFQFLQHVQSWHLLVFYLVVSLLDPRLFKTIRANAKTNT